MLSNPCVCFSSTDQNSSSRRNSRKNSTKINQAIPLYGLTGDTSIKSRSDGVVVVNEKYQRPKIPKITDFDKSKIYSWTSSKTPCPDYKYVINLLFLLFWQFKHDYLRNLWCLLLESGIIFLSTFQSPSI